jgi:FRG domain
MKEWEAEMIEDFRRAAHHYLKPGELPHVDDKLEWLALMQHYGAPTRLLDFTRSPYVAAFFALSEARDGSAVWALDANWCHATARNYVDTRNSTGDGEEMIRWPGREARRDFWEQEYIESLFDHDLVVIISLEPFRRNERLNIQRGVFVVPGNLDRPFMDIFKEFGSGGITDHVRKYVLEKQVQEKAIPDLNRMNINRASLFPGLDGYAQSLRLYPFVYEEDVQFR